MNSVLYNEPQKAEEKHISPHSFRGECGEKYVMLCSDFSLVECEL